jgi:hypothetical protein
MPHPGVSAPGSYREKTPRVGLPAGQVQHRLLPRHTTQDRSRGKVLVALLALTGPGF